MASAKVVVLVWWCCLGKEDLLEAFERAHWRASIPFSNRQPLPRRGRRARESEWVYLYFLLFVYSVTTVICFSFYLGTFLSIGRLQRLHLLHVPVMSISRFFCFWRKCENMSRFVLQLFSIAKSRRQLHDLAYQASEQVIPLSDTKNTSLSNHVCFQVDIRGRQTHLGQETATVLTPTSCLRTARFQKVLMATEARFRWNCPYWCFSST